MPELRHYFCPVQTEKSHFMILKTHRFPLIYKVMLVVLTCFLLSGYAAEVPTTATLTTKTIEHPALKYRLNMVFNNPAEAETVTKYTDSAFLVEREFNGMVPEWYIQFSHKTQKIIL
mgnify:CR=1 FL=1